MQLKKKEEQVGTNYAKTKSKMTEKENHLHLSERERKGYEQSQCRKEKKRVFFLSAKW